MLEGSFTVASKAEDLVYGAIYERATALAFVNAQFPKMTTQLIKPPTFSDLDWLVVKTSDDADPLLLCALEVKARRVSSTAFTTTILNERKHNAGRYFKFFWKLPTFAVILFSDTVGSLHLEETPDEIADVWARGKAVPHCHYSHSRMEWHPAVFDDIQRRVETAQLDALVAQSNAADNGWEATNLKSY